ncbi:MAG: fibronectin type III domain-containing protein, partial [Blastocatellia bacterium]
SVYRGYWDSPRANVSRDGRYAVYTSNWGSADRTDVFICRIPPISGGGSGGRDTTPPVISSVASSSVSAAGATITWATNEPSDTQVEYGATSAYGASTPLSPTGVTSHAVTLSGLAAGTAYHYRVKSRDAAGNLAASGDLIFTTAPASGGRQNVIWTAAVNCAVAGNSLQKNGGFEDTPDAGARSQQVIAAGDGYVEFTAAETNRTRFCGLTRITQGHNYEAIDFAIKVTDIGIAEVRENNLYQREVSYRSGDVFRVAIESGVVKYYKNGTVFYTSGKTPAYPLMADAALINMSCTVANAVIAATGSGTLAFDLGGGFPPAKGSGRLFVAINTPPGRMPSFDRAVPIRERRDSFADSRRGYAQGLSAGRLTIDDLSGLK